MNGRISVIIPIYNAEKYLDDCLKTVTGQTYSNLEILLVDDGSGDQSARVAERWCEKDSRIRLLQQENKGVSAARNLGMQHMTGEYVAFVDADDWILPDMLERQLACLMQENSDLVLCGFREVRDADRHSIAQKRNSEDIHSKKKDASDTIINNEGSYHTVDVRNYAGQYLFRGNTRCWSVLFSRTTIGDVRFREGLTIGEDMLFLVDVLDNLNRISVMEEKLYCYYQNEAGAMFSAFKDSYMDQIRCWELAVQKMQDQWPELLQLIEIGLFQAILLTVGKLAVGMNGKTGNGHPRKAESIEIQKYLEVCSNAARQSWKRLGNRGRQELPLGYQLKGFVFLAFPQLYLKLYQLWKGSD